ncbi:MAG: hypothetical protein J0M37_07215 [Ignavibacteria bacterium]|nr:hypothetical protein [Ignavibacteria bacterium]
MKKLSINFRSLVFTLVLVVSITGIFYNTAVSGENDNKQFETTYNEICDTCYIIYVWIDGVRWAQVYNQDGTMVNFYPDSED